jgi:hypothetical protein
MSLQRTIRITREIDIPVEFELDIDIFLIPGHPGYFDQQTGDCDPPQNHRIEVLTNDHIIIDTINSLFDYYRQETIRQTMRYLEKGLQEDIQNGTYEI